MKLSPKAIRFVVEALDEYVHGHDEQIRRRGPSEDDLGDWENDRQFIEAIKQDCLDELSQQAEQAHAEV